MINFAKGIKNCFVLALVVLTFCLLSSVLPVCSVGANDLLQECDDFNCSLMQIYDKYNPVDNHVMALAAEEEIVDQPLNRLIVTTEENIDDCGAVAKAEFADCHIFQYKSEEDARAAFEKFDSLNFEVDYDSVVAVNYEVDEDDEIVVDSAYTYNSWGAKYVGYETYITNMLSSVEQSDLNDVVVAVLDSGINTSHVMFEGRILHDYAKSWVNEDVSTNYRYEDMCGHGTHVSGIIADATLSNVTILPLKVLNASGKGYVSSIVAAINYAITLSETVLPQLKLMNMSIGVDDSSSVESETIGAKSISLTNAVEEAYNRGLLSVVSAGNENRNTAYAVPANVDCAITVSAVQKSYDIITGKTLVFHGAYSDYLGYHWGYSNYGSHVDFCAPGTAIKSAYIGSSTATESLNGTSMAAPHVAAAVALIYSNPDFENYDFEELNTLLKQNADKSELYTLGQFPVSKAENDDYYGYGLICLKNIGILTSGYVDFSQKNEIQTETFQLELNYDGEYDKLAGEYVKIYYSDNENINSLDINSTEKKLYSASIEISKTTKISAVACVYDADDNLLKKSHSSSMTYYFDNVDLVSNFDFEASSESLVIRKYNGKLETLNVQSVVNGAYVTAIDEGAFNDSNVKALYLPAVDNFKINNRAFYSNSNIEKIISDSPSLQIGNEAFRYCSNLSELEIENATLVGNFAFANSTKIEELYLPYVTNFGQHVISGSKIKTLLIGQNISNFGTQSNLALEKIYGYAGTAVETFASENDIDFFDLTLRIVDDFRSRKIIKTGQSVVFELEFVGLKPDYETLTEISGISSIMTKIDDYLYKIKATLSQLEIGENELSVKIKDAFANEVSSVATKIIVLSADAESFSVNFDEGNFDIFIDNEIASANTVLYKGFDYGVSVLPRAGYELESITLNGEIVSNTFVVENLSDELNFVVVADEKGFLDIKFLVDHGASVLYEGSQVTIASIARHETLSFEILLEDGYKIKEVYVNGQEILSDSNVYSFENVEQDLIVDVELSLLRYSVTTIFGKGGNIYRRGVDSQSTTVVHGSDLEYDIVCNEGYEIDFVTVNGKHVNLNGSTLKIESIQEDCEIVVSFKKESVSLFDGQYSTILTYFAIFAGLFIVFVIASVLLRIFRKKRKSL